MKSIYDIEIDATPFAANTAPRNGFVDPKSIYQYMNEAQAKPSTLAIAEAKTRATRRFINLTTELNMLGNVYVRDIVCDGTLAAAPTSITVTVEFESGDASLATLDELNAGVHLLGTAAIKRAVARMLTRTESKNLETFDPTAMTIVSNGADVSVPRGIVSNIVTVGSVADDIAAAEAAITITKIVS